MKAAVVLSPADETTGAGASLEITSTTGGADGDGDGRHARCKPTAANARFSPNDTTAKMMLGLMVLLFCFEPKSAA